MPYSFANPTRETVKDFIGLSSPHVDELYARVLEQVERGEYDFSKRWLFAFGGKALAALVRAPVPRPIYLLRALPELTDADKSALLDFAAKLSERDELATLNYNSATSPDFSRLALAEGWTLEGHVKGFETSLAERNDLKADPAAQTFALSHLLSEEFKTFYTPIWEHDAEVQGLEPLLQELQNFYDNNADGEGVYLLDGDKPVAAGVVEYEGPASMTLVGVLPEYRKRGWGRRLHRQLMWLAKQHAAVYSGSTAVNNASMLRLFEVNGCTFAGETWQIKAPR